MFTIWLLQEPIVSHVSTTPQDTANKFELKYWIQFIIIQISMEKKNIW